MLRGIAASGGIGIGKAVLIQEEAIEVEKNTILFVEDEKKRFLNAVEAFVGELEQARDAVQRNIGKSEAGILEAQIAIVRDQELTKEVLRTIERQHVNAEYAFSLICNGYIALFSSLEDELMSARSADFEDIRDRMLRILMGIGKMDLANLPKGSILLADDIPPSQTASIDRECVKGIVTRRGTRFSHIAIIARALQLPAVVAVENLFEMLKGGENLIIDGHSGRITINPSDDELQQYRQMIRVEDRYRKKLDSFKELPTTTADGKRIMLASNYAVEQELTAIRANQADGIGLYRTEILFMDCKKPPSEQEQYQAYKKAAQAFDDKPVIIRTLDIGGDKEVPCLKMEKEENPFLGHRAVRYCLDNPELFKTQIAAILRAAVYGNVHMMIPMISYLTELQRVRALLEEAKRELAARQEVFREDVPLGIMIETPAAVMCAQDLAKEADFFSIGTNDLTQYTLAVDRGNGSVASLYNHMHPAVLRMIAMAVRAAHAAGIEVSVCGESAYDPMMLPFLIGIGVDKLSVNSGALLIARSLIKGVSYAEWERRIPELLSLPTIDEIRRYMAVHIQSGT